MRRGALLGQRWSDIDLDAGTLLVRRTLSCGSPSRLEIEQPKTIAGRRRIALFVSTIERLRRHATKQKELWLAVGPSNADRDLVFATVNGMEEQYSLDRLLAQVLGQDGHPERSS